jgi:hypothetical protein
LRCTQEMPSSDVTIWPPSPTAAKIPCSKTTSVTAMGTLDREIHDSVTGSPMLLNSPTISKGEVKKAPPETNRLFPKATLFGIEPFGSKGAISRRVSHLVRGSGGPTASAFEMMPRQTDKKRYFHKCRNSFFRRFRLNNLDGLIRPFESGVTQSKVPS